MNLNYVPSKIILTPRLEATSCSICGRVFTTRHQVRVHLECVHLKIKRFVCATCGLRCYKKHDLKRHLKRKGHTGSLEPEYAQSASEQQALDLLDRLNDSIEAEKLGEFP